MTISDKLLEAYRLTNFHVFADEPFVLNIDKHSVEVESLHDAAAVQSSAFITAYNPYSEQCDQDKNEQAQRLLFQSIQKIGYSWIEAEGKDPSGLWLGEPSVLVLGCDLAEMRDLGNHFKQNAIVWIDIEAIPRLLVLRE